MSQLSTRRRVLALAISIVAAMLWVGASEAVDVSPPIRPSVAVPPAPDSAGPTPMTVVLDTNSQPKAQYQSVSFAGFSSDVVLPSPTPTPTPISLTIVLVASDPDPAIEVPAPSPPYPQGSTLLANCELFEFAGDSDPLPLIITDPPGHGTLTFLTHHACRSGPGPADCTGDGGDANILDVLRLLRHIGNPEVPLFCSDGDCTGGGGVNVVDVLRLVRHVGDPEFPVACHSDDQNIDTISVRYTRPATGPDDRFCFIVNDSTEAENAASDPACVDVVNLCDGKTDIVDVLRLLRNLRDPTIPILCPFG